MEAFYFGLHYEKRGHDKCGELGDSYKWLLGPRFKCEMGRLRKLLYLESVDYATAEKERKWKRLDFRNGLDV